MLSIFREVLQINIGGRADMFAAFGTQFDTKEEGEIRKCDGVCVWMSNLLR